jgi:hypothetical protein
MIVVSVLQAGTAAAETTKRAVISDRDWIESLKVSSWTVVHMGFEN